MVRGMPRGSVMGSFKLRLVVYLVLFVPRAARRSHLGVQRDTAERNELRRADASLAKSVGAAVGSAATTLDQAGIRRTGRWPPRSSPWFLAPPSTGP